MTRSQWFSLIASLTLVGCSQPETGTDAQNQDDEVFPATVSSRDFGSYELHFNAVTTDMLQPDTAREHSIVRSNSRILLSVSILKKQDGSLTPPQPVAGSVKASARNLTGQLRNLDVREIREAEAIYNIAETPVANAETLIFSVEAIPEGGTEPLKVSFRKQFFVDN